MTELLTTNSLMGVQELSRQEVKKRLLVVPALVPHVRVRLLVLVVGGVVMGGLLRGGILLLGVLLVALVLLLQWVRVGVAAVLLLVLEVRGQVLQARRARVAGEHVLMARLRVVGVRIVDGPIGRPARGLIGRDAAVPEAAVTHWGARMRGRIGIVGSVVVLVLAVARLLVAMAGGRGTCGVSSWQTLGVPASWGRLGAVPGVMLPKLALASS